MIYFTSDLHLNHKAIIWMMNRPFKNVEEMNETLIKNINETVKPSDTLYVLGDLSYRGKKSDVEDMVRKIRCRNIILCKGNHDRRYDESIFKELTDYKEICVNTNGTNNRLVTLMHYPIEDWKNRKHGSIHLHGHVHSNGSYNDLMRDNGIYRYDVGVDANNYRPVSLDEILVHMDLKC